MKNTIIQLLKDLRKWLIVWLCGFMLIFVGAYANKGITLDRINQPQQQVYAESLKKKAKSKPIEEALKK